KISDPWSAAELGIVGVGHVPNIAPAFEGPVIQQGACDAVGGRADGFCFASQFDGGNGVRRLQVGDRFGAELSHAVVAPTLDGAIIQKRTGVASASADTERDGLERVTHLIGLITEVLQVTRAQLTKLVVAPTFQVATIEHRARRASAGDRDRRSFSILAKIDTGELTGQERVTAVLGVTEPEFTRTVETPALDQPSRRQRARGIPTQGERDRLRATRRAAAITGGSLGVVVAIFTRLDLLVAARRRLANPELASPNARFTLACRHEIGATGQNLIAATDSRPRRCCTALAHDRRAATVGRVTELISRARRPGLPVMSVAREPSRAGVVFTRGRSFRRTGGKESGSVVDGPAFTTAAAVSAFAAFARGAVFIDVTGVAAAAALIIPSSGV